MKTHTPLTTKQMFAGICALIAFSALTLFLFAQGNDNHRFRTITHRLFLAEMAANTLNMHYTLAHPEDFGIDRYEAVLPLYCSDDKEASAAKYNELLSALRSLDSARLKGDNAYTCRLLIRSLEQSAKLSDYPYFEEPLSPHSGQQTQLPILLAEYTFRSRRDVEDYLSLLGQCPAYLDSLLLYEQEKARAGRIMPAASLQKVVDQCDTILTEEQLTAGTHFLQTTFRERIAHLEQENLISAREADAYIAQHESLLARQLLPAYCRLADGLFLLKDETIPLAGLSAVKGGDDYYRLLLNIRTGSDRSPEEIGELYHAYLLRELSDLKECIASLRSAEETESAAQKQDFPLNDISDILADLQARMKQDFPDFPSKSLPSIRVKKVSENMERYCAPAFYLTAPLDDSDTNVIYINTDSTPKGLELYTTLAHEGYPGHLYQTVYSNQTFQANDTDPIRQLLCYGGYQEGWALYVEMLSYDYAASLQQENGNTYAALLTKAQKHSRSLQLCLYSTLDLMIHYENASLSDAANYLEDFGFSPESAAQIYAYIAEDPCNYPKYYLGYLEILELKKVAQASWGEDYSDYAFHCFYLDCGPSDFTGLNECLAAAR